MSDERKKADAAAADAKVWWSAATKERAADRFDSAAECLRFADHLEARASRLAAEARHEERMEADDARDRGLNPEYTPALWDVENPAGETPTAVSPLPATARDQASSATITPPGTGAIPAPSAPSQTAPATGVVTAAEIPAADPDKPRPCPACDCEGDEVGQANPDVVLVELTRTIAENFSAYPTNPAAQREVAGRIDYALAERDERIKEREAEREA